MTHWITHCSTAELFQHEKQWYALSSTHRPEKEKTLECNVRQTYFPSLLHKEK
ncbi:hypothetical protein [Alkalihalobacillus sp. LMS39]|uniref:hypothetical protein n=1 Tax=Alkalihalobacillus sp. LMS39 TaxID=2924032 RepID=UPI001FB3FB91|nr:hypothetical protein [Alkalihalobacillus sp. LMS39]UOE92306.1 hypothetical protein MM271_13700 [Alkalihalobacillus sp. LMS39]